MAERGNFWAEKIHKNPSNSRHIGKFLKPNSRGFLVDEVWWVWHLKWCCMQSCKARFEKWQRFGQHLPQKGPRKRCSEILITTIKTLKDPFYNNNNWIKPMTNWTKNSHYKTLLPMLWRIKNGVLFKE